MQMTRHHPAGGGTEKLSEQIQSRREPLPIAAKGNDTDFCLRTLQGDRAEISVLVTSSGCERHRVESARGRR